MALDPAFVADCPYGPGGQLIDEVLEVDKAKSLVRARMPTHGELPLTREQRTHPRFHPAHVSGGLMVHMTGVLGYVHAYYVLDLRHRDGWVGYGVRIQSARFHNLARLGPPVILTGWCTHARTGTEKVLAKYEFEFHQEGTLVYQGEQTALWSKVPPE
ncbi:MAG: hypothetical protein K1X89_09485 [Myxococcaceae bacterium]|nr:hypothetical protein [Myxococcaceae bacterium]